MTASPLTSRFQIVERPVASPGKCAICGCTDRPVVDFGLDIEIFGVVYFCLICLTEAADTIGLVPEQRVRDAELEAGQSINSYLDQRELKVITNEQHRVLLDSVTRLSLALVSTKFDSVDSVDESDGTTDSEPAQGESGKPEGDAASSKQDSKPSRSRRPASVPSDSGNGSALDLNF